MLRLRVAEVILLPLGIWPYVLRRHQPGIVAESFEFPTEMMPFEVGNQVLISSHRKLLLSKAMVVSVAETAGRDPVRQG
jgi:hypothetical protein